MFLVEGSQDFDCSLVSPFGLMNLGTDMKAIDVKPTELMHRFGEKSFHWFQVSGVHVGQAQFDLFPKTSRKVRDYLADGVTTSFATSFQAQDQATQGIDDYHAQYLAAQLFEKDFIDADSLGYMSVSGLVKAVDLPRKSFCLACFTGDYPIPVQIEMDKMGLESDHVTDYQGPFGIKA